MYLQACGQLSGICTIPLGGGAGSIGVEFALALFQLGVQLSSSLCQPAVAVLPFDLQWTGCLLRMTRRSLQQGLAVGDHSVSS